LRVLIAGGRDYALDGDDYKRLDEAREQLPISEIVSRSARGADAATLDWAVDRGIPVTRFPTGWDRHAQSGSIQLSEEMASYVEALIAFPGSAGTDSIVAQAKERGLKILDWRKHK